MHIRRRDFLGGIAGSIGSLYLASARARVPDPERMPDCALFDLPADCVLRESFEGYRQALGGLAACVTEPRELQAACRMAIVPSLGSIDAVAARALAGLLERGGRVLLESAGGFLDPATFAEHQRSLLEYFDLAVGAPVDLWPTVRTAAGEGGASIPYLQYLWPRPAMVRDFSRAVPVSASGAEVIGRMPEFPVAVKRPVANGLLVFLGSPLGPALRSGDAEALSWLQSLVA